MNKIRVIILMALLSVVGACESAPQVLNQSKVEDTEDPIPTPENSVSDVGAFNHPCESENGWMSLGLHEYAVVEESKAPSVALLVDPFDYDEDGNPILKNAWSAIKGTFLLFSEGEWWVGITQESHQGAIVGDRYGLYRLSSAEWQHSFSRQFDIPDTLSPQRAYFNFQLVFGAEQGQFFSDWHKPFFLDATGTVHDLEIPEQYLPVSQLTYHATSQRLYLVHEQGLLSYQPVEKVWREAASLADGMGKISEVLVSVSPQNSRHICVLTELGVFCRSQKTRLWSQIKYDAEVTPTLPLQGLKYSPELQLFFALSGKQLFYATFTGGWKEWGQALPDDIEGIVVQSDGQVMALAKQALYSSEGPLQGWALQKSYDWDEANSHSDLILNEQSQEAYVLQHFERCNYTLSEPVCYQHTDLLSLCVPSQ